MANYVIDGLEAHVTGPLILRLVLVDPDTGEDLFVAGERTVEPGTGVTWTYPHDGIKVIAD